MENGMIPIGSFRELFHSYLDFIFAIVVNGIGEKEREREIKRDYCHMRPLARNLTKRANGVRLLKAPLARASRFCISFSFVKSSHRRQSSFGSVLPSGQRFIILRRRVLFVPLPSLPRTASKFSRHGAKLTEGRGSEDAVSSGKVLPLLHQRTVSSPFFFPDSFSILQLKSSPRGRGARPSCPISCARSLGQWHRGARVTKAHAKFSQLTHLHH